MEFQKKGKKFWDEKFDYEMKTQNYKKSQDFETKSHNCSTKCQYFEKRHSVFWETKVKKFSDKS